MPPELFRVHPGPSAPSSVLEAYDVERAPHADRPWIGVCMVASLDGSLALDGGSGALGNPNDLEVLLTLRDLADVIVVGAGTVRDEGYGPPRRSGRRVAVATNSGRVDLSTELFASGAGFLLAPESAEIDESRVQVLRAGRDELDLAAAIRHLDEIVPGVEYVQAEGGARLNGTLFDHDLIDELDLSLSPRIVGGIGSRIVAGATEIDRRYALQHVLVDDDGFVFTRWTRR